MRDFVHRTSPVWWCVVRCCSLPASRHTIPAPKIFFVPIVFVGFSSCDTGLCFRENFRFCLLCPLVSFFSFYLILLFSPLVFSLSSVFRRHPLACVRVSPQILCLFVYSVSWRFPVQKFGFREDFSSTKMMVLDASLETLKNLEVSRIKTRMYIRSFHFRRELHFLFFFFLHIFLQWSFYIWKYSNRFERVFSLLNRERNVRIFNSLIMNNQKYITDNFRKIWSRVNN